METYTEVNNRDCDSYQDFASANPKRDFYFYEDFGSGNPNPGTHWLKGIVIETVVLIVLYRVVFFMKLKPMIENFFKRNAATWQYMTTYKGMFHPNVQVEVLYLTILAFHHLIGGGMMMYGLMTGNTAIWIQGAIFDLVDAVHDTALMILPAWPFDDRNPKLLMLFLPHHAFSFIITVPVIITGMAADVHAQKIGACLLFAGGVSALILSFTRTCDRRDPCQAWQEAIAWIVNAAFYDYCRWWVFPVCAYNMLNDRWAGMGGAMQAAVVVVAVFMVFFNFLVGVDLHMTVVDRVKIALAGGQKEESKKPKALSE